MHSTRLELARGSCLTRLSFWRVFHSTTSADTPEGSRTLKIYGLNVACIPVPSRVQIRTDGLEPLTVEGLNLMPPTNWATCAYIKYSVSVSHIIVAT